LGIDDDTAAHVRGGGSSTTSDMPLRAPDEGIIRRATTGRDHDDIA